MLQFGKVAKKILFVNNLKTPRTKKCSFGQKSVFFHRNNRNPLKDSYLFGERIFFCLHKIALSWLEHGIQPKVGVFCQWPVRSPRRDGPFRR